MERTPIEANSRPKAIYRYTVTGTGVFPIDMLRCDQAWPAIQEAISAVGPGDLRHPAERRTVELQSYRPPMIDRWKSFGWLVE